MKTDRQAGRQEDAHSAHSAHSAHPLKRRGGRSEEIEEEAHGDGGKERQETQRQIGRRMLTRPTRLTRLAR